ncbi:hypothetical protein KBB12_01295 [Candidatus Woesebacteria bacterium]|nr:hypothetical protein [Candidatus Woesebacteria bacterium]
MKLPIHLPRSQTIKRQVVHKNVLFIDKTKLTCVVLPDKSVKEYIYPQDMVMDGDVMKKDDFRNAFIQWLIESGIKVTDTICIVNASAVFAKTIPPDPKNKTTDGAAINAFIDVVPFQHVATFKQRLKDNSVKVVVANKDLLLSIFHGLEKSANNMLGIFPELSLTAEAPTTPQEEDVVEKARKHLMLYTLKNSQQYIFDIFPSTHKSLTQMSVSEAAQQPVQPWVVVAVVALLIAGGGGVWYMQYYQVRQTQIALARKRAQLLAEQQSVQTPDTGAQKMVPVSAADMSTPSATIIPTGSASESATLTTTDTPDESPTPRLIRVQIVYNSQTQKLFDDIYNKLRQAGQYQISNQSSGRDTGENTLLLSSSLDAESVARITNAIQEVGIQTNTKEAAIDGFDAVIELGIYSPVAPIEDTPTPTP